jgi:mRNA-degrading endonuclease RelE of RelBE toxin-antitoxin system
MSYDIRYSDTFRRSAKALAKKHSSFKNDLSLFVKLLADDPDMGTPLGNNLFKVRMAISSKGGGKSGGARIITCVVYRREEILLAEIYDKGDYSTVDEKQVLKNLKNEGFSL